MPISTSSSPSPAAGLPTSLAAAPSLKASSPFGAGGSASVSSNAPLYGPELGIPLPDSLTSGLPFEAHLEIYAEALFGTMDIAGQSTSAEEYAGGLKILVPIWKPTNFVLSPYLAVGPAYLNTDLGHALGMDLAVGLRGDYSISQSVAIYVQVELDTFWGQGVGAWAPAVSLGMTLGF
jgi:hypothetical protein